MPALTPSFVFDFESNMQALTENEYSRLVKNLYWQKVAKVRPSGSKQEILAWLLTTAKIESLGLGGNIPFEDLIALDQTYKMLNAGAGLRLQRNQVEDLDGNGLDLATNWSTAMGAYMAYWPQKQLVTQILANPTCYDGLSFFNTGHYLNGRNSSAGTYSNSLAYATYKIDDTVTVDVALTNLGKLFAYIRTIPMPNGVDPRFLKPTAIVCPPRMIPRVQQLTNAKFIAQAANSGGGSGDVEALITNWGFAEPIEAPELANAITGVSDGDTTYYVVVEDQGATQLGPWIYFDREPFKITYYTGSGGGTGVDAVLDRARELEWHCQGRNVMGSGHPFLMIKVNGS
jgi:phage major head subunit gpT-like protein